MAMPTFTGRGVAMIALLLSLQFSVTEARGFRKLSGQKLFKQADSPFVGDPPIPVFGDKCAEVEVIPNAVLDGYYKVVTEPYTPPECSDWSQAVLKLQGAVKGNQF